MMIPRPVPTLPKTINATEVIATTNPRMISTQPIEISFLYILIIRGCRHEYNREIPLHYKNKADILSAIIRLTINGAGSMLKPSGLTRQGGLPSFG
jgi:hypothetical protein